MLQRRECERKSERKRGVKNLYHLIYGDAGRARKGLLACACVKVFGGCLTWPVSLSPSTSAATSCVYAKWAFVLDTFWLPSSDVCIGGGEERLAVDWWCVGGTGEGEYDLRDVNSNSRSGTLIAASCVCVSE